MQYVLSKHDQKHVQYREYTKTYILATVNWGYVGHGLLAT